jgi:hypothetical protein
MSLLTGEKPSQAVRIIAWIEVVAPRSRHRRLILRALSALSPL